VNVFDELEARNERAAANFTEVPMGPALDLVVVTCVDPRVHPTATLGIDPGDAFVMRVVGGRVTDAVVTGLAMVFAMKGAPQAVAVMHHTDCGTARLAGELAWEVSATTGQPAARFREIAVIDPHETVAADVARLFGSLPEGTPIAGFVYDVASGRVERVA
jgi:carbonic anhydrase